MNTPIIKNNLELMVSQFEGISRERVEEIQIEVLKMPQVEPITEHYFHAGMYCRKVSRKAGTLVVGKVHKKSHFYTCISGEIIVWNENGAQLLKPGDIILSQAGTKRITYAVTDAVGLTIHQIESTNVEDAEKELVEDDDSSTFTTGNKLKTQNLEQKEKL